MIADAIGGVCRMVTGTSARFDCGDDDGPRVYFANHASHLDFVMIWSALPSASRHRVRPVAGRDYWSRGRVRRFMSEHVFHAVLIDRGGGVAHPAAARTSITSMAGALDRGDSLIVFPEGTRSLDGTIGPFKSGLYHLARLRPDVGLVPVLLENTHRVLPKGEALPVPILTRVVFGSAIHPMAGESKPEFLARARGALIELGVCHDRRH